MVIGASITRETASEVSMSYCPVMVWQNHDLHQPITMEMAGLTLAVIRRALASGASIMLQTDSESGTKLWRAMVVRKIAKLPPTMMVTFGQISVSTPSRRESGILIMLRVALALGTPR